MISCPSGLLKMRGCFTAIEDALDKLEAIDKNGQDALELQHAEAIANASSASGLSNALNIQKKKSTLDHLKR
jgi:hypothetical protein